MSSELPVVLHRLSTESTCTRVASFVAKVLMPSLLYTNFATRETRHNRVPGGTVHITSNYTIGSTAPDSRVKLDPLDCHGGSFTPSYRA